ncbi:hypothetical protein CI102_3921 [Trichoderma harzianum]|uniref:Uncharacterized protein n=1 Tax=Trichoderma harzianum CBS 226.95 TaxID=983964 RepID=A0A2T4APY0_TRIHA|nr:hypothetical protein M431DRAFT_478239 [Trichoderma harzianum CBS 226.95]PKK49735.1 hypothetical protein CI102_3921 [Trichoderma harzianum]PTB59122.1 hypothetical protein M431DRAFT_478239 [Trichoderma harzianum CBS 226.95]
MKCLISLVVLYGALATALPSNTKAYNLPDIQDTAGLGLADTHKEGGDMPKRGICSNDALDCCCQCAKAENWPCIGCFGVKSCPHGGVTFANEAKYLKHDPWGSGTINFPAVQDAAGNDLAVTHNEGGGMLKRGFCTDHKPDCCCQCAEAEAWPCYGCTGEKQCINLGHVDFDSELLIVYETS